MAYETGVASNAEDLLDRFRVFAVAQGAVATQWYVDSGGRRVLHLTWGGKHFLLTSGTGSTNITLKLFTGVGTGLVWTAYTLAGIECATDVATGPYTAYHFFKSGGTLSCALEMTPGLYTHFSIGNIAQAGSYTGGEFVTVVRYYPAIDLHNVNTNYHATSFDSLNRANSINGQGYSGHIRCDFAGDATPRYRYFGRPVNDAGRAIGGGSGGFGGGNGIWPNGLLFERSPNTLNSRTILPSMPVYVMDSASANWVLIGFVAGVSYCNNKLILPGELVDTDWRVYPIKARHLTTPAHPTYSSGTHALAYKVND